MQQHISQQLVTSDIGVQLLPGGFESDVHPRRRYKNGYNPSIVRHAGGLVR